MSEKLCSVCEWPDKTIEIDGKWYCISHTPTTGGLSSGYIYQAKRIEVLESAIDPLLADAHELLRQFVMRQSPRIYNVLLDGYRCRYCGEHWMVDLSTSYSIPELLRMEQHTDTCLIAQAIVQFGGLDYILEEHS